MSTDEEIAQQQDLLATHRRTLSHLLKRQALVGEAFVPPDVANSIQQARKDIKRIKLILRNWKVDIEDHPDDSDPSVATTSTSNDQSKRKSPAINKKTNVVQKSQRKRTIVDAIILVMQQFGHPMTTAEIYHAILVLQRRVDETLA